MNVIETIQKRFPDLSSEKFKVQVDGKDYFLSKWDTTEPKPTSEQLMLWIEEDAANSPEQPISEIEILKKQITDLTFDLMTKGVL